MQCTHSCTVAVCVCCVCCMYVCSNAENTPHVCSLDDQLVESKQRRWGRSSFHSRSSSATNHNDEASNKGRGGAHSTTSPKKSKLRTRKQSPSRYCMYILLYMHCRIIICHYDKRNMNNACIPMHHTVKRKIVIGQELYSDVLLCV